MTQFLAVGFLPAGFSGLGVGWPALDAGTAEESEASFDPSQVGLEGIEGGEEESPVEPSSDDDTPTAAPKQQATLHRWLLPRFFCSF